MHEFSLSVTNLPTVRTVPTGLTSVLPADGSVVAPEGPMDMGDALGELLRAYCRKQDIPWKEEGNPPRRYHLTSS